MKKILFIVIFLIITCHVYANTTQKLDILDINVLQWWGYLSSTDPYIKNIEKECDVKISHDQYYSNDEFIDRIKHARTSYDIAIFSYTIFNAVKESVSLDESPLYQLSEKYHPSIRKQYQQYKLPHNILFFIHSLTGFLYNPDNIAFSQNDEIFDLFQRASKKLVVMIDDPVEADFLFTIGLESLNKQPNKPIPLTLKNFQKLYQTSNLMITDLPAKIASQPDFAFAFQWSGDAIRLIENSNHHLKFFVHPQLSYITTDLIAALNNNPRTICVAKKLASRQFLNHEQNQTYYFSPYADGSQITNPDFKKVFIDWSHHLSTLPWITSVDKKEFKRLDQIWNEIKLKIMELKTHEPL